MAEPLGAPARAVGTDPEEAPPPKVVGVVWALLLVNTLGFTDVDLLVPVPRPVFQMITMGAMLVAFALALLANPRVRVRPSAFLLVLSALVVIAVASSIRLEAGPGSLFRCFRITVFVATLWLLSRWWRGDLRFAGYHLRVVAGVLSTVLLGLIISPGAAFSDSAGDGRLVGAIWPIPAPQVGQYCAVLIGLASLMWVTRNLDGRSAAVLAVPAAVLLILTHTRTALLGLAVGLVVAGLSLVLTHARARRTLATVIGAGVLIVAAFGPALLTWLQRGQDPEMLTSLTGRQNKWDAVLERERDLLEQFFGIGLGDKSINGLAIDNSWLSTYHELGFVGLGVSIGLVLVLTVTALLRPPSPQRAIALFLITYCVVASYTEVGLGDASMYLLHLGVAASLLVVGAGSREQTAQSAGEAR